MATSGLAMADFYIQGVGEEHLSGFKVKTKVCIYRSAAFDIFLEQVASDCSSNQLLQELIRSRILCSATAADQIIKLCRDNRIDSLQDLSSADACNLSANLDLSEREIQHLLLPEVQFQSRVQFYLKKMQQEKYNVKMLQDAAEAISKIAVTVQDLQGISVMRLQSLGVDLVVRVWLCRNHLLQGSEQNVPVFLSEQQFTEIQERTSDPNYVSMESAVLEVKKALKDGFELQHLSVLTENLQGGHRKSIEYGQYSQNDIFFADQIPVTNDEHLAANDALRDQGLVMINTESAAIEVVDSPEFKKLEGGRLFDAVCQEESAARESLRSEEEVLTGVDTDSEEESDNTEHRSDGFVPCAEKEGGCRGKRRQRSHPTAAEKPALNITAILVCVHSFLVSIKFETIFQVFNKNEDGDLTEAVGDGKRLQVKMRQLPAVSRKPNEKDAPYYRRLAGREFLFLFLHKMFHLLSDWLPNEYTFERFWDDMFAGVVKTLALASGQHLHADKEPDRHGLGVSVLINLSIWSNWITSLLRSSKNVEALLEYYRQKYDLFATVFLANTPEIATQSLSQEKLNKMLLLPWQCHLNLHVRDHPSSFLPMQLADIELVPALMMVFRLNHVHGGGPYPGKVPRRLRDYSVPDARKRKLSTISAKRRQWQYRYGKAHFRSGPKCQIDFSHTSDQWNFASKIIDYCCFFPCMKICEVSYLTLVGGRAVGWVCRGHIMLVGRNELVDPATRKEGEPAFSANPLPTNKLTCSLFHYCALTQLVQVCWGVEVFLLACQPALLLNHSL